MADEFLTPGRTKALRRLLLVILVLAGVVALLGVAFVAGGNAPGGALILGIAAVLGGTAWLAFRAVTTGAASARRLSILTAVLTLLSSLPLMYLIVGLLTVVAGVGLLFIVFAAEREAT